MAIHYSQPVLSADCRVLSTAAIMFYRRSRRRAVWVLAIFVFCWPAQGFAEFSRALPLNRFTVSRRALNNTAGFYTMPAALADDYFDGTSPMTRVKRHFMAARRAGVGYLRCAFAWNGIEPKQGEFRWKFWDNFVSLAEQNHIKIIPYVAYTPQWAARNGKDFWKQPPRKPELYADFMFQIAARYRGRVGAWEIWNEPDNKDYWTGTPDEFAELAMLAAKRIREADPNAVLILGGVAYGPSKFLQVLITGYHLDRYVDVVAMHAYPESWLNVPMEKIFEQWVPAIAQLIDGDDSGDDLWVNEMGYPDYRYRRNQASVYGGDVNYGYEHTSAYQANMLFKMEVMAVASDRVSLTGWYRIDDFPLGEKRLGGDLVNYHLGVEDVAQRPKPAFFALAFFNRLFKQPTLHLRENHTRAQDSQAILEVFQRKDKKVIVVGWLRSSRADEVVDKSGIAEDRRTETISAELPCAGARLLGSYNARGIQLPRRSRVQNGLLQNIRLRGDQIFVAELSCGTAPH